ncbi:MAG: hypothetical protein WCC63_04880 [Candidatus Bathyarchaeia archaeon]
MELQDAQCIAVSFVKEKKNVDEVNVIVTEQKDEVWIIKGTCPIDLAGHPWRESFEITIDAKGKIRDSSFRLM